MVATDQPASAETSVGVPTGAYRPEGSRRRLEGKTRKRVAGLVEAEGDTVMAMKLTIAELGEFVLQC